jgi:hypothetical protein
MAILQLLDNINQNLDRGEFTAGIFLDFSKAFDTINHHLFLLSHYGISGIANLWIASYLEGRTQYCTINGKKSEEAKVTCSVPQ